MADLDENSPFIDSPSTAVHASAEQATDSQPTISNTSRKKRNRGGSNENDSNSSKTSASPLAPKSQKARRTSISRWNAQKHGILSKNVILKTAELGEKQEDFNFLLEELRTDLQPIGILEEMQVELIATSYWRLGRAFKSESGLLDYYVGPNKLIDTLKKFEELDANRYATACATFLNVKLANKLVSPEDFLGDPAELEQEAFKARQKLRNSSAGLHELIRCVNGYIEMVNKDGILDKSSLAILQAQLGVEEPNILILPGIIAMMEEARSPDGHRGDEKSSTKEWLLAELTRLREVLNARLGAVKMVEELQAEASTRAKLVPDEGAMDRILRYQTSALRNLHRAMQQLERLQRIRKGEHVPAPIAFA